MPLTLIPFSQTMYNHSMYEVMCNEDIIVFAAIEEEMIADRRLTCDVCDIPERFFYGLN